MSDFIKVACSEPNCGAETYYLRGSYGPPGWKYKVADHPAESILGFAPKDVLTIRAICPSCSKKYPTKEKE